MENVDSLLGMDMLDLRQMMVLNIPHASIHIPSYNNLMNTYDDEILKLTDWATDILFDFHDISKVKTKVSRIYCDTERFSNDEDEEMSKVGRGFYYTNKDNGELLRVCNERDWWYVKNNFYDKHHRKILQKVKNKLNQHDKCIIIDCHSFNDIPLETDLIKETPRPDICLGVDDYHTPKHLYQMFKVRFEELGLSVKLNNPYSGTIVPMKYYKKDNRVESIMIEINKKLYMDGDNINTQKLLNVKKIIDEVFYG